jgi:transposase
MAKKAQNQIKNNQSELMIVNPDAAGIDISSTVHQVCVPVNRGKDNNRCFGSFTSDLHAIAKWLKECNIKTVAMESTGIYWVQLFLVLQEYGFDVLLVNAKHIKNIGEKKTDIVDAHWIMLLHSYGLLKASYQPDNNTRELREYMRQRETLIQSASREVLHMQKALEQMNIKVHKVISDILGKSGMAIIEAILKGIRNPKILAEFADIRIKASKEEIIKSLEGNWTKSQLFILRQSHELYQFYKSRIEQCDLQIQEYLKDLQIANTPIKEQGINTSSEKKSPVQKESKRTA